MRVRVVRRVHGDNVVAGNADIGTPVGDLVDDVFRALEQNFRLGNRRNPADILARIRTPDAQPGALKKASRRVLVRPLARQRDAQVRAVSHPPATCSGVGTPLWTVVASVETSISSICV